MTKDTVRLTSVLSWLIVIFMASVSAGGLFMPDVYRDNALVASALRGNDLVTLFIATPLLLVSMLITQHSQSIRAKLVWMGMLGYGIYNYSFYLFGASFNVFFLLYVALFSLSIWALIAGLSSLNVARIAQAFSNKTPVRVIAGFMIFFALFLGGLWISRTIGFLITGEVPEDITKTGHVTGIVYALDLSLLVPALLVGAVLLWRKQPWGYVIAAILMIKATTYSIALLAMSPFAAAAGVPNAWSLTGLWIGLGFGTFMAMLLLLANVKEVASPE